MRDAQSLSERPTLMRQLWTVIGILLTVGTLPAAAGEFSLQSLPLPINVDGQRVRSSLYLQLEVKPYGIPLETFLSGLLDTREAIFAQVALTLRTKEYERIRAVWETPQKGGTKASENLSLENYVDLYREATNNFQKVTVLSQALVGSQSVFLWEAVTERGSLQRAFAVQPGKDNRLTVTPILGDSPVQFQLVYFMEEAVKNPDAYRPVLNHTAKYRYRLPVAGDSEHPVHLQFDGEFVDFPVFDAAVPPPNPLLGFYRDAYLAYKDRNFERFIALHTAKSQEKLRQWYASMKPEVFEQFYALTVQGRHVSFLLDARPVSIVFYSAEKPEKLTPEVLSYQYLMQGPPPVTPQLTNIFFQSFLDDILRNPQLFDLSTLKESQKKT